VEVKVLLFSPRSLGEDGLVGEARQLWVKRQQLLASEIVDLRLQKAKAIAPWSVTGQKVDTVHDLKAALDYLTQQ
jgi:hypothetical protein